MLKIIIVDDNETFRKGLGFFLEQILGYSVINEASNGAELLKLDNIQSADLILMDIEMPELNGIETTRQLNWMFRDIKTIAISGYSDAVYLQQLIGAGFKGYVLKKNIYDDLPAAINSVLQNNYFFQNKDRESITK